MSSKDRKILKSNFSVISPSPNHHQYNFTHLCSLQLKKKRLCFFTIQYVPPVSKKREIRIDEERTERWTDKSEMNVRSVTLCAVLQLNHQKAV